MTGAHDKYHTALALADACGSAGHDVAAASAAMDALLSYCRENFPLSQNHSIDTLKEMWQNSRDFTKDQLRTIPPLVVDELYPATLALLVMKYDNAMVDSSILNELGYFHDTYSQIVLSSFDKKSRI